MRKGLEVGGKRLEREQGEPRRARRDAEGRAPLVCGLRAAEARPGGACGRRGADERKEGSERGAKGRGHGENSAFGETDRSSVVHRLLSRKRGCMRRA